ncbi:TBC1 domain family member 31-like [Clytia hemisphaerica]|uniref:TBC1 domain family member 31 n=1 Tax=Clytia hemisphaerica TaxID=252671 RepID=A0A7M5WTD1_9CNID
MVIHITLDIGCKQSGQLWTRKVTPEVEDGLVLNIKNVSSNGFTTRHIRFQHLAYDSSGDRIATSDHHGNIHVLDLQKNRYNLVYSCGIALTSIIWNNYRINEIVIALSNNEVRCYDIGKRSLLSILKGHTSPVDSLSIHGSGRYLLTSSFDTTILWDLNTFTKKRTLNGAQEVGIQKVFFLPNSNHIVSCFQDDSIFVWDCESMKCVYQLTVPPERKPAFKCLTATNDCRVLVGGGRSRFLYLWNMDNRQLIQVIELPDKVKSVKDIQFVTNVMALNQHQLLGVLAQDGVIRFIDTNNCSLKAELGSTSKRIHSFLLSMNSQYIGLIMDNGEIALHHLPTVIKDKQTHKFTVKKIASQTSSSNTIPSMNNNKHTKEKETESVTKENQPPRSTISYRKTQDASPQSRLNVGGISIKRLKTILQGFGEYPSKYRQLIWKNLLAIPENHTSFSALVDKGIHNAYIAIHERYPIKSQKLLRVLQRVLSALAHWSPIFGETEYLPMLVFPFVKMFPNNQLVCFEFVVTILMNWCQRWFEYFPNPPLSILAMVETLLSHHDPVLLKHFIDLDISTQLYAWPMLQTLYSEVLTRDDWLIVWDNVFSSHPSFMLYFLVAYLIHSRKALLCTQTKENIKVFFHHQNPVDIAMVIKETYRLSSSTPPDLDPKKSLDDRVPLPEGQYPIFDFYPKFVVNYLVEERERIREEELEYLRQKQLALDMKRQKELTQKEELAYYREQEQVVNAENERRQIIANEEKRLASQRKKLQSLRRDIAMQELEMHDEVRRKFFHHQRQQKQMQLQRLDDEMKRKFEQREVEMKDALTDAEIKAMQIKAQKLQLEEDLMREDVESSFRLQSEREILRQHEEQSSRKMKRVIDKAYAVDAEKLKEYQTELGKVGQRRQNIQVQADLAAQNKKWDMEREIQALQIARMNEENEQIENELHQTIRQSILHQREMMDDEQTVRSEKNFNDQLPTTSDRVMRGHRVLARDEDDLSDRGSFTGRQMDLMTQVRDLRTQMARKQKQLSVVD